MNRLSALFVLGWASLASGQLNPAQVTIYSNYTTGCCILNQPVAIDLYPNLNGASQLPFTKVAVPFVVKGKSYLTGIHLALKYVFTAKYTVRVAPDQGGVPGASIWTHEAIIKSESSDVLVTQDLMQTLHLNLPVLEDGRTYWIILENSEGTVNQTVSWLTNLQGVFGQYAVFQRHDAQNRPVFKWILKTGPLPALELIGSRRIG